MSVTMSETPFNLRYGKRACAICGSVASKLLFRQAFSEISSGSLLPGYDVVVCDKCGFSFADNIPDQTAFNIYYREMSKYEHKERLGHESEYALAKFKEIASILKPFLPDIRMCVMEIGCATGTLLSLLKENGYENLLGIDPSPACAEAAHRLYGVRVLPHTLSDIELPDCSISFIILAGVLEHVRDLSTALSKLWNILSVNGRIYVSVPDASRYNEGEDAPFQEFSIEHINFFGPTSLTNLMHINGFRQLFNQGSMIQVNKRTATPIIHAIYEKSTREPSDASFEPDLQTMPGLVGYIDHSHLVDDRIHKVIDELAPGGRPIIVWGVGTHTQRLLASSRLAQANIVAFVDSNPNYHGKYLNGVPIIPPGNLSGRSEAILVSSRIFQSEIVHQIHSDLNLGNEVFTLYED
jgi:SAM-dependent methyltransferase